MGGPVDVELDFKARFNNLQGIHINERKRNFYKLLNSTSSDIDIPDDQIDIQPRSYQENIFYVDVLIHFKKVNKLIDILKKGVGVLSSKILKQRWFFQEAFKDMSEEEIVNNFLPTLSYSLRLKVLKKLSQTLSTERMDKIFDLVLERYGLFIAKRFLFSCTSEKIVHFLENNEITLLSQQLKRLLQKDLNLVKLYINQYKKNTNKDFNDSDFLNYLVWKHPNLYFELGLNSESFIKLGRRTARAVIKTNEKEVLEDIKNPRLNKAALVREIKEFDKDYLFLFFPTDIMKINNFAARDLMSLISKYPVKKRWDVFSQGFLKAYSKEVVEHLEICKKEVAQFFPKEITQKWAKLMYLRTNDVGYIKYYDPKEAFQLLKDKINVTSNMNQRGNFLNQLVNVCCQNKDYATFEEMLKYICSRSRNEDKSIRSKLIYEIENNLEYNVITEAHWKYINEMLDIERVRGENVSTRIMAQYVVFVCKKELSLDESVTQYAKDCIGNNDSFRLHFVKGPKEVGVESTVLKHIAKILPSIECTSSKHTSRIISNIVDFNQELKNDKIADKEFEKYWIDLKEYPLILDLVNEVLIKKVLESDDLYLAVKVMIYSCLYSEIPLKINHGALLTIMKTFSDDKFWGHMVSEGILEIIKKPNRNSFENTLLDHFFKSTNEDMKKEAIAHFLAKEPEVIAKYFDGILLLEATSNTDLLDYNAVKKYSHLGLVEKVIAHFKALVSVGSENDRKIKLLNALSKVTNTVDFLDLVKDYTPEEKKLDLDNDVQKEMYQVQCDIAKAFKNLDDVSVLAPVLMHFCQGDYLQSSLPALYKVVYRMNEEKAFFYINVLGERAVSTRKHAVFLGFETLPFKSALTFYSVASNKETNTSAKKYLFDSFLKYFIKNPVRSLLDIVVLNMDFVDKNDIEMINKLVESVDKIQKNYRSLFIEKVWDYLDILDRQEVEVTRHRSTLLHAINKYEISFILLLNKNFCEDIINKHFLSSDDRLLKQSNEIDLFVVHFLLAYLDEPHFEFVFNIIKNYKNTQWDSNRRNTTTYIMRFFTTAYEVCDDNDVQFLELFTSFWQRVFNHLETFSEYILLRLMALYKENPNIAAFCNEVNTFFQEFTAENGPYISDLIIESIESFHSNIDSVDFSLGNFAFNLLQSNSSEFNCFIAFKIIKYLTCRNQEEIYLKVLNALKSASNVTAKVYCNILLKGI